MTTMTAQSPSIEPELDINAGTFWRHYKGTLYQVIGLGHHTELRTRLGDRDKPEPHVMYQEVREGDKEPDERIWLRPLRMWHEFVTVVGDDGETEDVPRFAHEPSKSDRELRTR